jgi:hypothetical protein
MHVSVTRFKCWSSSSSSWDAIVERRAPAPALNRLRTERLDLTLAGGLTLPARLIHPRDERVRGSVVVAADHDRAPERERLAAAWGERGYLALLLDVRGAGALAPVEGKSGYSSDYQLAARAWLLGTSVVAWQTCDLVTGLRFLARELPDPDAERSVHVGGLVAPAGFFAAAIQGVDALWVEGGLVSYLELAATRDYAAPARLFVPGVLEVTDLPEVMALTSPGTVHLVRPIHADGTVVSGDEDLGRLMGGSVPPNVRFDPGGRSASRESPSSSRGANAAAPTSTPGR